MNVVLFEDRRAEQLYPITLSRPAYVVSAGGARLVDVVSAAGLTMNAAVVRPHLATLQTGVFGVDASRLNDQARTLWINARLVPKYALVGQLKEFLQTTSPRIVKQNDEVIFAITETPSSLPGPDEMDQFFAAAESGSTSSCCIPLLAYPHDVVRSHLEVLDDNLQTHLQRGQYKEIRDGVFAAANVLLDEYVVTDTSSGPIILENGVHIHALSSIRGPALLGMNTTVLSHSALHGYVTCGLNCKLGGEIAETAIESYTNKQHHGFLGHAYVGSWVNMGAGTSNSDLKNTYGTIRMQYGGESVETNMQFLGCIVGDYVKTAINTSIFTGRTIGVCSMVYGTVATNVPSFVNYARDAGQVNELPFEVAVTTQRRTFGRRNVPHCHEHEQLIRDMFALTQDERASSSLEVGQGMVSF